MTLPIKALFIRQPWAWAIIYGGKKIENRDWRAHPDNIKFRGPLCIHASTGMTQLEYIATAEFMAEIGVACPPAAELRRGGIIGVANLVDIITKSDNPWFFGPKGLVLEDIQPVEFVPVAGALGFFNWLRADDDYPLKPARWMVASPADPDPELDLFGTATTNQIELL